MSGRLQRSSERKNEQSFGRSSGDHCAARERVIEHQWAVEAHLSEAFGFG
jgi:hypothetical protein